MKFKALVTVMPHREILDPQGKAVESGLAQMGIERIHDVRIGKMIEFNIEAINADLAKTNVETATKNLLANLIMEEYKIEIQEIY